jgi:hypothetical protein
MEELSLNGVEIDLRDVELGDSWLQLVAPANSHGSLTTGTNLRIELDLHQEGALCASPTSARSKAWKGVSL